MIELVYSGTTPQTVAIGQSVVYNVEAAKGGCAERHRAGSAQLTLVKPGRYLVSFAGISRFRLQVEPSGKFPWGLR